MAVAFRGVGALVQGTTSPLTPDIDAVGAQANDVGLLVAGTRASGGTSVTSTDWTLIDTTLNATPAPDIELHTLRQLLSAGETDPSVACAAPGNQWGCLLAAWSGVDATTPVDATTTEATGASATPTSPAITTVTDGAMVVAIVYSRATAGVWSLGTANGFTLRAAVRPGPISIGIADMIQAPAGLVTMPVWSQSAAYDYSAQTIALRPAADERPPASRNRPGGVERVSRPSRASASGV